MADMPGFGFTYSPPEPVKPVQLFAWQVCLLHLDRNALEDASNYADYAINRDRITQTLGLGLAQGQNVFALDGQLFAVAVSVQRDGGSLEVINESFPRYDDVVLVVAEQLLRGDDHGMVALLPNGHLVPFVPSTGIADL